MSTTQTPEKREFQAEVSQVLDIVINSLYTDKEIFVRELVSNASDALEKMRHTQLTESEVHQPDLPLEIQIESDAEAKTVTIIDHGLGMTREELHENIGTIAHSGSKAFVKALEENQKKESALIGQFGVGFYSAFMVADEVTVYSRSWREGEPSLVWKSDGKTGYEIEESEEELDRGCKVVLKLREECEDFSEEGRIKTILENYSAFVSFPIMIGEDRVNTIEAIWRKKKADVTDEQYNEFYKFSSKAFDEPRYRMHFSSEMPIEINVLLFVPTENTELFGMGQMEPGVSLYCKNVLIDDKPEGLLPEWLRFIRGVIDSADIPLNISRESMQDSSLVRKLNRVVTKRFLKFLASEVKSNADKYKEFYAKFGRYLKEGIVVDFDHREALTKLLRFESSMTDVGEQTGFEDYMTRAKDGQDKIYYLTGADRAAIEAGPYLEALKSRGLEVIYFADQIDDYLLQHLREFDGKSLVSAASSELELEDDAASEPEGEMLPEADLEALSTFLKEELSESLENVTAGKRLVSSPAAVLTSDQGMTAQMRQMMQAMNPEGALPEEKVNLEINPRHSLIHQLSGIIESNPDLAKLVASQLLDNALLSAGMLDDRANLVNRGFSLMEEAMKKSSDS